MALLPETCTDRDCNSVINGGHWCKDHRLCKTEGCGHQRAVTASGKYEDVCWQRCVNIINGGVRFCLQHECMYPPCREQKDSAADTSRLYCTSPRYCVTHECAGVGCSHPSKPAGRFCAVHACLHASCASPRAADPLIIPGSQFCTAHECRAAGCYGAARPDGSYCEDAHACAVPGCPAPRGFGVSDGGTGAASVCCASHTAIIARDSAAAWSLHASSEGRTMRRPPPAMPAQAQARPLRYSYLSQTEEALDQRLREERERQDQEARLDQELRTWHAAAAAPRGAAVRDSGLSGISGISGIGGIRGVGATIGLETRGRGVRRGRSGSHDSGFGGSPTVLSDLTSSNTFVS
ncbi:hypothetical protein ColLi_10435 [Colletotrichum liriopes]|uniref:Uncharacterized protein n=1 Tax=Colletotrichum liriopes TaxID=708192 RepID=A0AA37LWY0_9PEZI|nr:hypothetical protein ColLi_10435 [Colletotrichum liriopes]